MLDHVEVTVADLTKARAFYDMALAPVDVAVVMTHYSGLSLGYGSGGQPHFWITQAPSLVGFLHVAFAAKDRASVDAFYREAIAAGGRDNGPPGPRPHYHSNYYAAFVFDPDGHNVEAVCRAQV
jgi:catechol 2,3-dioxygenase-like lactoylglutathione lyase family enzyme